MKPSEILKLIKAGINLDKNCGICSNFTWCMDGSAKELITIMEQYDIDFNDWENFSGDYEYPVPSNNPSFAYWHFDKWSKKTKYGQLRWQLLDWLIEQFEAKGA